MAKLRLGALEAGGTKMVCAIGDENGTIYEQVSIPTITPKETIPKMIAYFRDKGIDALGIACFGPIELDRDSEKYGYITTTPKLAWRDCDIVGQMQEALHCPVGFDTDVNGSVLGEVTFGQAQGKKCVMYLTIGTGVGGGIYSNGELHHGMLHPETGHVLITKRTADTYAGRCPYHKNCLEGANDITIFSKIVLPLSKPIIATMTLYYAVYHWNSYFPSMLYLNDQKKYPVQVVMRDIVIQGDTSEITGSVNIIATNYKYAVIIISIVPILLVYPLLQKYFTKGVMVGAVKG